MSSTRRGAEAWEEHWRAYDEAARRNPAQRYRRRMLFRRIEQTTVEPLRILDVGCGQGDFLQEARIRFPRAELAGIDFSRSGLELAAKRATGATLFRTDFASDDPLPSALDGFATHAVCAEVLEHLDDPETLLRKLSTALAPGGELIVTVPGGPRSAFDVHIGHRRHYTPAELARLARRAGYDVTYVAGAGFPFFNLYKLVVYLRGRKLASDIDQSQPLSRASLVAMDVFDRLFAWNLDRTRLGWQIFGIFHRASDR